MVDAEKNIAKGSLSILSGTILSILVSMIVTPIIVRKIGPEGFGELAIVLSVYALLYAASDLGLSDSIRKHVAERKSDYKIRSDIASISITILTVSGILTLLIVTITVDWIFDSYITASLANNTKIITFGLVFSKMYTASRSLVIGLHKEEKIEFLQPLNIILYGVFAISLVYSGYGTKGVVIGQSLAMAITATISFIIASKYYTFSWINTINGHKKYSKKLISYGLLALITILLIQFLYQTDLLMIKYFMTDRDVGIYKGALTISEYLWLVPSAIQMSLLHTSSEMWSKREYIKIDQISSKLMSYTSSLLVLLTLGLVVLSKPFIRVYFGIEFLDAVQPLNILLIGSFAFGLSRIVSPILQGKGELFLVIKCTFIAVILNVSLNWILIPMYGISGAAIATSISYFSMILSHSMAVKKVGINVYQGISKKKIAIFALILYLALSTVYKIFNVFINNDLVSLFIIPPIGLAMSLFIIVKLNIIPASEFKKLIQLIPSISFKGRV